MSTVGYLCIAYSPDFHQGFTNISQGSLFRVHTKNSHRQTTHPGGPLRSGKSSYNVTIGANHVLQSSTFYRAFILEKNSMYSIRPCLSTKSAMPYCISTPSAYCILYYAPRHLLRTPREPFSLIPHSPLGFVVCHLRQPSQRRQPLQRRH